MARARKANERRLLRVNSEVGQAVVPVDYDVRDLELENLNFKVEALKQDIAELELERKAVRNSCRRFVVQLHKSREKRDAGGTHLKEAAKSPAAAAGSRATPEAEAQLLARWQAVPTADGRTYYWNTDTNEVSWTLPTAMAKPGGSGDCAAEASISTAEASISTAEVRTRRWGAASSSAEVLRAQGHGAAECGVDGLHHGGAKHDVASLVFCKYDTSCDGVLSDGELETLCKAMDRSLADPRRLSLLRKLMDVDGDGVLTRAEFVRWWRQGEEQCWRLFESTEHERATRGLADFFSAFGPNGGALSNEPLARMHLCLRERGHTSKPLVAFLVDVDPEHMHDGKTEDCRVTFHKLHAWYFREHVLREPPHKPSLAERRRPVHVEGREDMLAEKRSREREVAAMKLRAGRPLSGASAAHISVRAAVARHSGIGTPRRKSGTLQELIEANRRAEAAVADGAPCAAAQQAAALERAAQKAVAERSAPLSLAVEMVAVEREMTQGAAAQKVTAIEAAAQFAVAQRAAPQRAAAQQTAAEEQRVVAARAVAAQVADSETAVNEDDAATMAGKAATTVSAAAGRLPRYHLFDDHVKDQSHGRVVYHHVQTRDGTLPRTPLAFCLPLPEVQRFATSVGIHWNDETCQRCPILKHIDGPTTAYRPFEEVAFATDTVFAYEDDEETIFFTGVNPLDVTVGDGSTEDEFFVRAQPVDWLAQVEALLGATADWIYLDWDGTVCLTASTDDIDMARFTDEECVDLYLGGPKRMRRLQAILANARVAVLTAQRQSKQEVLRRFRRISGLLDMDVRKIHVVGSGEQKLTLLQEEVKHAPITMR